MKIKPSGGGRLRDYREKNLRDYSILNRVACVVAR